MKENFDFKLAWQDIKRDFSRRALPKTIWKLLLVVLGSILLAAGDELFLIPYGIVSGGVGGLGIIAYKALGWSEEITITVLQWIMFVIGFVLLGAKFSIKTLISTIVYPIFLFIFQTIYEGSDFFKIAMTTNPQTTVEAGANVGALLLAGGFGGALVGVGCGLTFIGGGSTGGTDCLSLALAKYAHLKASIGSLAIDMIVILSDIGFEKNFVPIAIGLISAFFCAFMIDKTYIGGNDSYMALIVSDKWETINKLINTDLQRGTTLLDCYGGYTGEEKTMIQVMFSKDEYDDVQRIVYSADPHAFLSILKDTEVTGYGFRKVPFRINREIEFENRQGKRTKAKNPNADLIDGSDITFIRRRDGYNKKDKPEEKKAEEKTKEKGKDDK
jgi:uncharacterized membrane-anchored protein YitT (DUF2179 family)